MSTTAKPYGLRPLVAPGRDAMSMCQAIPGGISSGYASAIGLNSPVILGTSGVITIGTTAASLFGSFAGCSYFPTNGLITVVSQNWIASSAYVAGTMIAYIVNDPSAQYAIQSNGSLAQTSIGDQGDVVNPSTVDGLGFSSTSLNSTLAGAGSQKQIRINGLLQTVDNAWGDTYTEVIGSLAQHQYIADKVAV